MNQNPLLTPGCDDELNWLAFRYVAGELNEDEAEAFEARMLDDLAVCEAVAAMSELALSAQTAAAVETPEPVRLTENPRLRRVRIRSWIAVGSTVVALSWLVLLLGKSGEETIIAPRTFANYSEAQAAADLIARWSQSEEADFSNEFPEVTPLELIGGDDAERPDIPTWMIAAVSLNNSASPSDEMPDMPSDMNPMKTKEN